MTAICAVKYFNQTSNETYFAKGLRFAPTEAIEFSIAQARAILQNEAIDLVFLDIEMPSQSGLDFARELILSAQTPLVVFITAYNKHAVSAFEFLHSIIY